MAPRQPGRHDDEKAHERAVVSPERERGDYALAPDLGAGGDDRGASRFGLPDEPAGQRSRRRVVPSSGMLDGSAETVFVP